MLPALVTKFRPEKFKHNKESNFCLCFNFYCQNFVRGADDSGILQELRINSKAICFLQSEFFKNFKIDSFLEQTKELNENWRCSYWNSPNKNLDWKLLELTCTSLTFSLIFCLFPFLFWPFVPLEPFSVESELLWKADEILLVWKSL